MVHWIWLVVAFITGGSTGFLLLGLMTANQEEHRKWWDDG